MIDENYDLKLKLVDASSKEQNLKDMEILEKILEGEITIEKMDEFSKKRIIKICNERLKVMNAKVENMKNRTERLKDLLVKVEKI